MAVGTKVSVTNGAPSSPTITGTGGGVAPTGVLVTSLSTNTATIYLGGSDVSTANGTPLEPGDSIGLDLLANETLYARSATGTQDLRILWLGL